MKKHIDKKNRKKMSMYNEYNLEIRIAIIYTRTNAHTAREEMSLYIYIAGDTTEIRKKRRQFKIETYATLKRAMRNCMNFKMCAHVTKGEQMIFQSVCLFVRE